MTTLLTVRQTAERLGVSGTRVRQFIHAHRLPAQRLGRDWIIDAPDLERFAAVPRRPGRPITTGAGRHRKRSTPPAPTPDD
jgi:excisionase family DNA binding protein